MLRNALFGKISHSLHSSMPIALAYKKGRLVNGRLDLETALWIVIMGGVERKALCMMRKHAWISGFLDHFCAAV